MALNSIPHKLQGSSKRRGLGCVNSHPGSAWLQLSKQPRLFSNLCISFRKRYNMMEFLNLQFLMVHREQPQTTSIQHPDLSEATCTQHQITPRWPLHMQLLHLTTFIPHPMRRRNNSTLNMLVRLLITVQHLQTRTLLMLIKGLPLVSKYSLISEFLGSSQVINQKFKSNIHPLCNSLSFPVSCLP